MFGIFLKDISRLQQDKTKELRFNSIFSDSKGMFLVLEFPYFEFL